MSLNQRCQNVSTSFCANSKRCLMLTGYLNGPAGILDVAHPRGRFFFFFNYYLAAPRPTSGHYRGDSLTHPMLITAFVHVRPEGHREPRSEVGSLSLAERLAGFEPGTFRFL